MNNIALLILASAFTSVAIKHRAIVIEDEMDQILNDGYCQAKERAGLTASQCKEAKWDRLVKLAVNIMSDCIEIKSSTKDHSLLEELLLNTTQRSVNYVKIVILAYVKGCLEAEGANAAFKYSPPTEDPCISSSTLNLTEWWRQDDEGSNIKPVNRDYNCDRELQNNRIWFRVTGSAGSHLRDECVPSLSCGSHGGFWSDAKMPNEVGETWKVPVYGSLNGNCSWYTWSVDKALTVKRCSHQQYDLIYKLHGTQDCHWSICGME